MVSLPSLHSVALLDTSKPSPPESYLAVASEADPLGDDSRDSVAVGPFGGLFVSTEEMKTLKD
jgi:hypothetical protein